MLKKNHIFGYIEKTYLMQACYPNFFEASNHIEKENTIIWSIVKMYTGTPLEPTLMWAKGPALGPVRSFSADRRNNIE